MDLAEPTGMKLCSDGLAFHGSRMFDAFVLKYTNGRKIYFHITRFAGKPEKPTTPRPPCPYCGRPPNNDGQGNAGVEDHWHDPHNIICRKG
jgi:hypothetical protein